MLFSQIKLLLIAVIVMVVAGGLWYISEMKANLAIAKENQVKLEQGIKEQQAVMELMKADAKTQQRFNNELMESARKQQADMDSLQKKLDANRLANIAKAKPEVLQQKVNRGTINAVRCIELASGAAWNEKEKAAKTAKEFNNECPNYWVEQKK